MIFAFTQTSTNCKYIEDNFLTGRNGRSRACIFKNITTLQVISSCVSVCNLRYSNQLMYFPVNDTVCLHNVAEKKPFLRYIWKLFVTATTKIIQVKNCYIYKELKNFILYLELLTTKTVKSYSIYISVLIYFLSSCKIAYYFLFVFI